MLFLYQISWRIYSYFVVANPDQCRAGNQAGCVVDSNFGRVTSPLNRNFGTGTNRQMQFMLRINY
jgi:hypothetical protein